MSSGYIDMSTPAQIAQQNIVFKQALDAGKISQAQYDAAIGQNSLNMAHAAQTSSQGAMLSQQSGGTLPPQQSQPQTTYYERTPTQQANVVTGTTPVQSFVGTPGNATPVVDEPVIQSQPQQVYYERTPEQEANVVTGTIPVKQTVLETPKVEAAPISAMPTDPTQVESNTQGNWKAVNPITPPPAPKAGPNIGGALADPWGFVQSIFPAVKIAAEKTNGPVGDIAQVGVGAVGTVLNQKVAVTNTIGKITNQPPDPFHYTPTTEAEKYGQYGMQATEVAAAVVVAPVIGSAIGIGAGGVIAGEVLGVGINQGFKFYNQGLNAKGLLTPLEIGESAAEGGIFSLVGGGIFKGIGVAGKALDLGLPSGAKGVAVSILGRSSVNAGIGGTAGFVASGGDVGATEQGLGFGALFSLGMEPVGYLGARAPSVRFGEAKVPFVDTVNGEVYSGETSYRGLYYQQGENAKPLIGKWTDVPGEGARVRPTIGESPGYQPKSALEAEVTRKVMLETGTSKETIDINRKAVDVTMAGKAVRNPKLFQDYLPRETGTSTINEASELKSYIIQNKDVVAKVFGKASAIPQENPEYGYEVVDAKGQVKSSVRDTADFDIQLKPGIPKERVQEFAKGAFDIYAKNPEANASMKEGSSLINTTPVELRGTGSKVTAHAVDIHSDFDSAMNPQQAGGAQIGDKTWGIPISEKPRLIEKVPVANIKEQVAAKFGSIFNINEEGEFAPVPHRGKDIPDFLMDARTLVEQRSNPSVKAKGLADLQDIADYFGAGKIGELKSTEPRTEEYLLSRSTSTSSNRGSSPYASMPTGYSKGSTGLLDVPTSLPSQTNKEKNQPSRISNAPSRKSENYLGIPSYLSNTYPQAKAPSVPSITSEDPLDYKTPTYPLSRPPPLRPATSPILKPTLFLPNSSKPSIFLPQKSTSLPSESFSYERPYPYTPPYPSSSKSKDKNNFFPPGNKFESGGTSLHPFKITGLDTQKQIYPIFSGKEVLRI